MSILEADHVQANHTYWQRGYDAPNVESWVFRWNGRILKRLGVTSGNLLDWGCGQGATVDFFRRQGFDAYGVDISAPDLAAARNKIPENRLKLLAAKPDKAPFFDVKFDVVVSIQSLYFLSDHDMAVAIANIHEQMKPGAVLYATMIASESRFGRESKPGPDGLRHVDIDTGRYRVDSFMNFTTDEKHLVARFPGFEPILTGYYDADWGEGSEKHWHITARKISDAEKAIIKHERLMQPYR